MLQFHRAENSLARYDFWCALATYKAFFDESDDGKGERLLVVGGYVVRSEVVPEFEGRWREVLRDVDVSFFHMKDCAHGNGEFKGKPLEAVRAGTELIKLIKRFSVFGVCCITPLAHFESDDDIPRPYSFLAEQCVSSVLTTLRFGFDRDPKISFIFESGYSGAKELTQHLEEKGDDLMKKHVVSHEFVPKEGACLLQAADLLAWQTAKNVKSMITKERGPRQDYLSLLQHRHFFAYIAPVDGKILIVADEMPGADSPDRAQLIGDLFSGKRVTEPPLVAFWNQPGRKDHT